jgi:hypothetical protein
MTVSDVEVPALVRFNLGIERAAGARLDVGQGKLL